MKIGLGGVSPPMRNKVVAVCGTALVVFGVSAELGWALEVPPLKSILPGAIAMNPVSAALFLIVGSGMLSRWLGARHSKALLALAACLMVLVGAVKIYGYGIGQSIPIDRLLFWSKLEPSRPFHGNAMAPNAALCFVISSFGLVSILLPKSRRVFSNVSSILVLLIASTAIVGYASSALMLYDFGDLAPMSLPTSISFVMLSICCLTLSPSMGLEQVFARNAIGSTLVQRVLPIAVLTPILIGVARYFAEKYHILHPVEASAIGIISTMLVIAGVILSAVRTLNINDLKRQKADEQLVQLTQELREEVKRSNEANRLKSEFVANMSHEVRTPLNGVLGVTNILNAMSLDPKAHKLVGLIRNSGESLLRLINDILDLAKIESGKVPLSRVAFSLVDMFYEVTTHHQQDAEKKKIRLRIGTPQPMPPAVYADPVRLKQVLGNLVSNAVKFTQRGRIDVSLLSSVERDGRVDVAIVVEDTGIGIAENRHAEIFESFTQVEGGTNRRFGGTGIGLALCKRLVELMGGSIHVASSDKGSIFTVRLSLEVAPEAERVDTDDVRRPLGLTVLLVEDDEVNAMVAIAALEQLGCAIERVDNGIQAVQRVAEGRFDIVLMDIHMPDCDGLEATRKIRSTPEGVSVYILALTASSLFSDLQDCLAAGMDGYLAKPFSLEQLRDVLKKAA